MKEAIISSNNNVYYLQMSDEKVRITAGFNVTNSTRGNIIPPAGYSINGYPTIRIYDGRYVELTLDKPNKRFTVTAGDWIPVGVPVANVTGFIPAVYAAIISNVTAGANTVLANGQSLKTILQNFQAQITAALASVGLIKVTAADTTAGYLNDKIANGTGLDKTTLNPAGNEQLQLKLSNTAVTPGTYGSTTEAPFIDVDQQGRIILASNVTITPAASSITSGQALSKTDDTNVTLTLGGTPLTALLKAVSLTLGWTGLLSIARGGTGQTTASAAFDALVPGAWTDYSGSSTITGWSSTTTSSIRYMVFGKTMFVDFFIAGTSNSTAVSFTLPFTTANTSVNPTAPIRFINNGAGSTTPGLVRVLGNSNVVDCYTTWNFGVWNAANGKTIVGQMTIEIA